MLRWPPNAAKAIAALFRPLQDIDVFVEDEGSEAFYTELLSRLVERRFRIKRVIPLLGRQAVEQAALAHVPGARPVLFIVDGDLDWVYGVSHSPLPHLYRLDAYCVENYLICADGAIEILVETHGALLREAALKLLDWESWRANVADPLVELFILFAIAHVLNSGLPTVSCGHATVCDGSKKGRPPVFDPAKLSKKTAEFRAELEAVLGPDVVASEVAKLSLRVGRLPDRLRAVSGKHFLLPLLRFHLNSLARGDYGNKSFLFRLARHCDLTPLQPLLNALVRAASRLST